MFLPLSGLIETNFDLYVQCLELIVGYYFALHHYNYAPWVPIHIRDMKSMSASIRESFKKHWIVAKTSNSFTSIPVDQMYEQENAILIGVGGVIGFTKNPAALSHWIICALKLRNLLVNLKVNLMSCTDLCN